MSDPNAKTKQRQLFILGGASVGILALVGAGMFLFDSQPPVSKEKPKTVSLTPPGTVEDKDAWRANEAAANKANKTVLDEQQSKIKGQDEQLKKLREELEAMKLEKAKGGAAGTSEQGDKGSKYMTADEAAKKVLDQPLPAGGQKVLNSPNGSPANGQAGPGGRLPQSGQAGVLNRPINEQAQAQPVGLEIVKFVPGQGSGGQQAGGSAPGAEVVGFPVDERAKKVQQPRDDDKKTAIEFMPAGSFVRVAMLNGVDAPTGGQAQSNPLPMAFEVLDVANLANKYRLDIKNCRFIAAAWGDLSSERTMGRTETLSCIINGETVEMPVKGQVIGEDGKAGIRGRLVTKQGQMLANALFAGSLSGIGRAFQSAATSTTTNGGGVTQTIDPDKIAQAGIGGGVSQAALMMAQYYLKAADKLFPVIETDGGRVVEILLTKGATFTAKNNRKDTYRSLMRRTGTQARSGEDD